LNLTAKVELTVVTLLVGLSLIGFVSGPEQISSVNFIFLLSGLFLAQTLMRDLWLVFSLPQREEANFEEKSVFCIETLLGITGVAMGIVLLILASETSLSLTPITWAMVLGGIGFGCFLLRDMVVQWKPWRIYRDPDHINIVVKFR